MGVNVQVNAVFDPDGKLGRMLDLKEACEAVNASYPKELSDYFAGTDVLHGLSREQALQEMTERSLIHDELIKSYHGLTEGKPEYGNGMLIDLSRLPDGVKKLRIYMS
jgi:hypothetical protein